MMNGQKPTEMSYFPGCSLATTAKENSQTLQAVSARLGVNLVELADWNCCGSSSAHSVNSELAFQLANRNLSLAPAGRPLLVACPSCNLRLRLAQEKLNSSEKARQDYEHRWGRPVDRTLEIVDFFTLLVDRARAGQRPVGSLRGLKAAAYYGCMRSQPPSLALKPATDPDRHHIIENTLRQCGAEPTRWNHAAKCCGTFLSAARPDVATPLVNAIMQDAVNAGAECVVTACAMCHLNLEIRCRIPKKLPVLHFSELLAIAFDIPLRKEWLSRHLTDPLPVLKSRGLMA